MKLCAAFAFLAAAASAVQQHRLGEQVIALTGEAQGIAGVQFVAYDPKFNEFLLYAPHDSRYYWSSWADFSAYDRYQLYSQLPQQYYYNNYLAPLYAQNNPYLYNYYGGANFPPLGSSPAGGSYLAASAAESKRQ